ncbi:MAG: GGDEF domain-containing protein, partial [Candidatus Limnocylindrales bacterium]
SLALPHDGSLIRTSASIGLVTYPSDGRTWAELFRRADLAMYEAKRRGRDQIVHYGRDATAPPQAAGRVGHAPAGAAQRDSDLNGNQAGPIPAGPPPTPRPTTTAVAPRAMGPGVPAQAAAVPVDIPPESPRPAPWETRGG